MTRIFTFSVLAVLTLSLAMGVGSVAAQQEPVEEAAEAANETVNGTPDNVIETRQGYEEPVDSDVTVSGWSYDIEEERYTITIQVNSSTRVSMTEVVSQEEASTGSLNVFQDRLSDGTHEIEMAASPGASGEAQIVISTAESVRNGDATYISTGYVPQELPFEQTNSTAGWLGGSVTTIAMIAAAAWRTKNKEHDPVVVCE